MKNTLGIDVGTNSVGWALINENGIIDTGVRIFSEGVNRVKGVEESRNVKRREARGIRRKLFRYKLRRELLMRKLDDLNMYPEHFTETPAELYELRAKGLDERITLFQLGRILLLLNKRRGFKSNRKSEQSEEAKSKSDYYKELDELNEKIKLFGCRTVGEYFYTLFKQGSQLNDNTYEANERIRARFVYRDNYITEFDLIWDKQAEFYPDTLTEKNKIEIRDNIIFYARPLKSQKHLVAKCRFEPKKRVAPKSSPQFQEFRIWHTINSIRVDDKKEIHRKLEQSEKLKLANFLMVNSDISHAKIKKILSLESSASLNDLPPKIKGNTTYSKIMQVVGTDKFNSLSDRELFLIWEKLYYAHDSEWLVNNLQAKHGLPLDVAKKLANVALEQDYGNLSTKAIGKILKHLKQGKEYNKACEEEGYRHSDYFLEGEERPPLTEKILVSNNDPVLSQIMSPLVKRSVTECIKVINAVIKKYGKPDIVRIEMGRDLNMPKDIREKSHRNNRDKRALRDEYEKFLKEKFHFDRVGKSELLKFELWLELEHSGAELSKLTSELSSDDFRRFSRNVKPSDKEKFRLWLECGRISVYTGKVISVERLFSPEYEVEHIIPYSVSFDDSFANKTLSERTFNRDKGNKTPIEYFAENEDELRKFKQRTTKFGNAKKERLLLEEIPDEFRPDQLNNDRWVAVALKKKCLEAIESVEVTNGAATAKLRRYWGLNTIIKSEEDKKSRDDHRHHAIDAIVIAYTSIRFLQQISRYHSLRIHDKVIQDRFEPPFEGFRNEVVKFVSSILVSHRKDKRLLSTKNNKYYHRRSGSREHQKGIMSVRGQLHEETIYGKILDPYSGREEYVVKKQLSKLTPEQVDKIVDKPIIELIKETAELTGKSIKQVLNEDLVQYNEAGKGVRIRSVRIKAVHKPQSIIVKDKNGKISERNVMLKNNYCANIYANKKGKKIMNIISFYDAVNRKIRNQSLIDDFPELEYLFTITQDDYLLILDENIDDIPDDKDYIFNHLYKIRKFTGNEIGILHHCDSENKNLWRMNCSKQKYIKVEVDILGRIERRI